MVSYFFSAHIIQTQERGLQAAADMRPKNDKSLKVTPIPPFYRPMENTQTLAQQNILSLLYLLSSIMDVQPFLSFENIQTVSCVPRLFAHLCFRSLFYSIAWPPFLTSLLQYRIFFSKLSSEIVMQEKNVQLFSTRIRAAVHTTAGLNLGSVYP